MNISYIRVVAILKFEQKMYWVNLFSLLLFFVFQQTKISVAEDYFGSGGIFSITVYSGLSLFVVLTGVGLTWEMYKKTKKKNHQENGQTGE